MDILPTQVYEDDTFTSTQKLSDSLQHETTQEIEIGTLSIGSNSYPIKKGINKIGRHPECNILLNDQTVSKKHAEIEVTNGETWLCDLNSSNKTKLNSSILRPGRYYELKSGSVIEFGMVRAVYTVNRSMDESLVPETPAPTRLKKPQTVILGTPDVSMRNSSASEGNVSMIPATQADNGDSVFRRPSVPSRSSASNRKSFVPDSSIDDSINDSGSSSMLEKEHSDRRRVSIHDMETQKTLESESETSIDIHDVETQKISLNSFKHSHNQTDIHDLETQHEEGTEIQYVATDIHDVETQHDIGIHDLKTPSMIESRNVSATDDKSAGVMEKCETENTELQNNISGIEAKKNKVEEKKVCTNTAGQSIKAEVIKTDDFTNFEQSENDQKSSQEYLHLSLTTNFDDECSELDRSRNLLGSQNLLEDFIGDDDPVNESRSKSSSPVKSSNMNNNETIENSSSDENIFNAATQVKIKEEDVLKNVAQRVNYKFKASLIEDDSDDDTDQEGVFQRYVRVDSQDSSQDIKFSKSQSSSEDSDTDEDGHFTEIAKKEKQAASMSFEARQSESKEGKNDNESSRDSYDLFDVPTQKLSLKDQNSSSRQSKDNEDIDFNAPTQVIEVNNPKSDIKIETQEEHVDDLLPTQILPSSEASTNINVTKDKAAFLVKEEDGEVEYNTSTKMISENVSISSDPSHKNSVQLDPSIVEEFSIEDIDYEMAPTQLLGEMEKQKSKSTSPKKRKSKTSNKVNLNDTLERNLNEMFDDVNEDIEDQPQISTQILTDILQLSQSDDKPTDKNIDKNPPENNKNRKSPKETKSSKPATNSKSPVLSNRKSSRFSLKKATSDNDSQNYFSNLTSTRKSNVLKDSQDLGIPSENISDNKNELGTKLINNNTTNDKNSTSNISLTSSPKRLLRTRFPNSYDTKDAQESERILQKTNMSSSNDVSKEYKKDDQTSASIVNSRQPQDTITTLESDEEDIMAGLPEVRISGTLSNPASPTSSTSTEFRLYTSRLKSKQGSRKTETKQKEAPKRSTRKSLARKNSKVDESSNVSKSKSATISNTSDEFNVARVPMTLYESDKVKINEITPTIRTSLRKPKESESLQRKSKLPITSQERDGLSIQDNGRTRLSLKENVDCSSVFQVGKEAPIAKEATESSKKTTLRASRAVKRSLSATDETESNKAKKRKGDINESTSAGTRKRKGDARSVAANRSNSANILDYINKRNSAVNMENPENSQQSFNSSQESISSKQLIIKITKLSSSTPTPRSSPSPSAKSITESNQNETMQNKRTSVNNRSGINNSSNAENDKPVTRRSNTRKATKKRQLIVEDITSDVGEESQEVEMIMNASLQEQSISLNKKNPKNTNENTINIKTRGTRKRGYTNAHSSEDIIENTSSEIYETDNACFEVPTSKPKRAKVSKNAASTDNSVVNESTKRGRRGNKRSSQSIRDLQHSIIDSSLEEVTDANVNKSIVNKTVSKEGNVPKKKGRKAKTQKLETEKKKNTDIINETSSEINSSIDTSVLSTPTRARRSLSTSFTTSSPYKIKHKVLFTGITNDYNKFLTKLGSSQVEDPTKCSVLVTDKVRRTVKFLCALAQAIPIVSVDWLVESEKAGHFTELANYILKDPAAEAKFGFKLRGSLEKARKQKLLDGYTVVLTPNVAPPPLPELKSIISSCGGKPLVRSPLSWPQKAVIISREEDLENAKKFLLKAPKSVTVQSTEFILTGILRQELDFVKYKVI
nr:mediator of DNA damage checkpoint protein 1 isoform X1 [Nomia melanderi]